MQCPLLIIFIAAVVVSGQETKPHSNTHKRDSASISNNATDSAGQTVIIVDQHTLQRQEDNHSQQSKPSFRDLLLPQNLPNVVLVAVGILGVVVAVCSLKRIDKQITEMRRQVDASLLQLRAMNEQITQMSEQTALLREYVGHTETTAIAAKESADAARDSVETFISKERARLRIEVLPFDTRFSTAAAFVKYRVHFHGNADAFISQSAAYAIITASDVPNIDDEQAAIFQMALPDVIDRATDLTAQRMVSAYSEKVGQSLSALVTSINEAKAFLHFYAFIKYKTLDKDREIRVCLTWNVNLALNALMGSRVDRWQNSGSEQSNRET